VDERALYLNGIEHHLRSLEPLKYIMLSYLVHPRIEYHTQIYDTFPLHQMIMDEWQKYALNKNNLNRSIGILKKTMRNLSIDDFMELLHRLQPWMHSKTMLDILQYQANFGCNGCVAANLCKVTSKQWICHLAIKTMLLMYFAVDLYENHAKYFDELHFKFIIRHVWDSCPQFYAKSHIPSLHMIGYHMVKDHIIHKIRKDESEEQFILKPPVISIETFRQVQRTMINDLKNGNVYHRRNVDDCIWIANEKGQQTKFK